jgi:hypothetical protein
MEGCIQREGKKELVNQNQELESVKCKQVEHLKIMQKKKSSEKGIGNDEKIKIQTVIGGRSGPSGVCLN